MKSNVAVIGLGQMGSTLAKLLLAQGYRVQVWNRNVQRAAPLAALGAQVAETPAAAIMASDIVVICVHDRAASQQIFSAPGAAEALRGRLLVQLSTGSPEEARAAEKWALGQGADYLDGAIQVAPSQMGRPDTTILLSGAPTASERGRDVLAVFGGNVVYLGAQAGAAATMDMATLSYVYGAILGFIHGARVSEAEGLSLEAYGRIVAAMSPAYGEFLQHEARVIASGDFTASESPLSISVEATQRLERIARASGLDARVPALAAKLLREASDKGLGGEEIAALIKVLR